MKDEKKTKAQLIGELRDLRQQLAELKSSVRYPKQEKQKSLGTHEEIGRRLEERTEELAVHARIIKNILSTLDFEKRLDLILQEVMTFLGVEMGGICLVKEDRILLRSHRGLSSRLRSHLLSFPASHPPEWIREPTILHLRLDEEGPIPDFAKEEGIQSWVAIPLVIPRSEKSQGEEWLGSIFVSSRNYNALDERDMESLYKMADQLALAIDHSRAYLHAKQRLARLETLHKIDRAIIQRLNLKDILYVVLDQVPVELGADAVAISLMNQHQGRPEVFAMRLPNGTVVEEEAFILAESLLHWFVERKETVIIYEVSEDPRLQMHWEKIHGHRLSSYLGVPLIVHENTIGILHILTKEPKVFEHEDVAFFRTMAGQVAIAIENARLYEEATQHVLDLAKKVAELKSTEESLRKSEARLAEAQRIAQMGNWDWDISNNKIFWSDEVYRIFALTPQEFDGTYEAFLNRVHPSDRESVKRSVDEALNRNRPYSMEHRIVLPDGSDRIVYERAEVHFDEDGGPIRMIGTLQDVTKAKELERVLIQQEKMASLGHVAAGIAHEIRNPLSGINIFLDAIRETLREPENIEEIEAMIDEAKAAAGRIDAVVKRVMDFARPGIPQMKLIDINEPVREAINLSSVSLRKTGIQLETDLRSNLSAVYADKQLMEQVILNLISNATDALAEIEERKKVVVSTHEEKGHIVISVCDSGPGIPPNERKKVFEPFYTTKEGGSGIGLSLCQRIVVDHGGAIEVRSSGLGGADFAIHIPVEKRTRGK